MIKITRKISFLLLTLLLSYETAFAAAYLEAGLLGDLFDYALSDSDESETLDQFDVLDDFSGEAGEPGEHAPGILAGTVSSWWDYVKRAGGQATSLVGSASTAAVRGSVHAVTSAIDVGAREIADSHVATSVSSHVVRCIKQTNELFMDQAVQEVTSPEMTAKIRALAHGCEGHVGTVAEALAKGAARSIDPIARKAIGYAAAGVGTVLALAVLGHYMKVYINTSLFTPQLIAEQSKTGVWATLVKRSGYGLFNGPRYSDLILAPESKAELDQYFLALKSAKKHGFEMPSLLLYGPPGTGKSEIARRMAKELGHNFAFMSGSSFSQFDEELALTKMTELFKWANNKNRQTIIFIDEAESLLASRDSVGRSEKSQKLTTHLLYLSQTLSPNFSVIYATNRPDRLDVALNRRMTYQVEVGLPDHLARINIAAYYFDAYIKDNKKLVVDANLTAAYQEIAEHTAGLSGAYIVEIWQRVRDMAVLNEGRVTGAMIKKASQQVEQKAKGKKPNLSPQVAPARQAA